MLALKKCIFLFSINFVILILIIVSYYVTYMGDIAEDSILNTIQLLRKYGYPAEQYAVATEDGYILEMHRIPNPGGRPVLLMHCLLGSSAIWVLTGPKKGFAYMLHDLGYDVWMANARGNTYGKNHIHLDPGQSAFWNFSLHELGTKDLPAMVDYVIQETGFKRIHFVGHSLGTTIFWIMCSDQPRYNTKILSMQALAPTAYMDNCESPVVKYLSGFSQPLLVIANYLGINQILPNNDFFKYTFNYLCKDGSFVQSICAHSLFILTGYNDDQMNRTLLPVTLSHAPAGASLNQMAHYAQIANSGQFRPYDQEEEILPEYNLSNVQCKVALHYSENDWMAGVKDVERLDNELPNSIGKFLVPDPKFNHMDFLWAIDGRELLYERVVATMRDVETNETEETG